jgi:predicted RNA-binding protein YlxR (DUF448 family)
MDTQVNRKLIPRAVNRTCVGCRRTGQPSELIRLVCRQNAVILVDRERKLPGRGAYLHNDSQCIDQAIARKALNRAFRQKVTTTNLHDDIQKLDLTPSTSPFGESMSAPTSTH